MPDNETLLEEIRERFDEDVREWADIRDEGMRDMQMIADGPWPADERKARADKDNQRPCESFDELGQYLNQAIGDMRQNKRAVKVTPTGNGANDMTAEKRASMIRQIEYDSNAQTAYQTGCENMFKRSYGYVKLGSRFANPAGGFEQELYIGTVPNPDTILLDPWAKQPDWSDMGHAFELDSYSEKEFGKKWPDAERKSFDGDSARIAPAWIKGNRIQVASYWRLDKKNRRQVRFDAGQGPVEFFLDELPGAKIDRNQLVTPEGHAIQLLKVRKVEEPSVCQYITNGLEILETNPQKWIEIPIIPMFGPEEWVTDQGGVAAKRRLLSMVRKARGAYMGYCYARTTEIEVLGMSPKIIYLGYEGQFDTKTPWNKINKSNLPYGEVKARTTVTGQDVLPLPTRQPYDPPIQSLEQAAASFRLAIQSAMGISGMLNGQRSQNQDAKSGKAIEALDRQENQGTFVFVSNYERGLARCGRMLEQGLTWCYDTPREVGGRSPSDAYSTMKINQTEVDEKGQPKVDDQGQPVQPFHTNVGDHATTISVGPSEMSERDTANDFVESLMGIPNLPPKIMSLAVKLKNLGPIGDEIAEAFDPEGPNPQAMQQQVQGMTQELAKAHAFAQSLHEQIESKSAELASREKIAAMQEETKRVLGLATLDSKEATTKLENELNIIHQKVDQVHERLMQAADQAHQAATQGIDQAHASAAQASDQAHASETQASDQSAAADSQQSAQEAAAAQQPKE